MERVSIHEQNEPGRLEREVGRLKDKNDILSLRNEELEAEVHSLACRIITMRHIFGTMPTREDYARLQQENESLKQEVSMFKLDVDDLK